MTNSSLHNRALSVAAVVAGLGLVAASFAPIASAATTTTTTTTTTSATFTRDLTLGSTGADVTALQTWLISKGHTIAAGATGYFGAQTRAALAAWQAANGITPAAGYFGPITRGRVAAGQIVIKDQPQKNESETVDPEEIVVEVEIRDGRAFVEAVYNDETSSFTLRTTSRTKIVREIAKRLNVSVEEVREVIEYETNTSNQGSSSSSVTSNASAESVSGSDNDVATFEVRTQIKAVGGDMFIPRNGSSAFSYQFENASTGVIVSGATAQSAVISSSADTEGNRYRINEGQSEEFVMTVSFDPLASDEGQSYRLQLLTVNFSSTESGATESFVLRPESKYQTQAVLIAD